MQYVHLGRSGLKVSRLALGTMNFGDATDETTSFTIMDAAVDAGINLFDTADVYGGPQSPDMLLTLPVTPTAIRRHGLQAIAGGKPFLGLMAKLQIVRRAGAAHLQPDPRNFLNQAPASSATLRHTVATTAARATGTSPSPRHGRC